MQSDSSKVVALFAGGSLFHHGCCDNTTLMGFPGQVLKCYVVSTTTIDGHREAGTRKTSQINLQIWTIHIVPVSWHT